LFPIVRRSPTIPVEKEIKKAQEELESEKLKVEFDEIQTKIKTTKQRKK
jgi:hypothetical protein